MKYFNRAYKISNLTTAKTSKTIKFAKFGYSYPHGDGLNLLTIRAKFIAFYPNNTPQTKHIIAVRVLCKIALPHLSNLVFKFWLCLKKY